MATNYLGVRTATQPPSATPGINVSPTLSLPDDGDPLVAASVIQAFKASADFIAYVNQIHEWQRLTNDDLLLARMFNSAGKLRESFDHNGLFTHRGLTVLEDFLFYANVAGASAVGTGLTNYSKWALNQTANGELFVPGISTDAGYGVHGAIVELYNTALSGNYSGLFGPYTGAGSWFRLNSTSSLCMQWDATLSLSAANVTAYMGIGGATPPSGTADFPGFGFIKTAALGNNWHAWSRGTTTETTDTGISAATLDTVRTFRCERHGVSTQYGALQTRFFINGAQVAAHTTGTAQPANGIFFLPGFSVRATSNLSTGVDLFFAQLKILSNNFDNPSAQ